MTSGRGSIIAVLAAAALIAPGPDFGITADSSGSRQVRQPPVTAGPPAREDPEAVAALLKMHVPLERDPQGRVRWIESINGEINDKAMSLLPALPQLEWLEIGAGDVTAKGIENLKKCPAMKRLYLHGIKLSDESLAFLSAMPRLEALSLQDAGISGRALESLKFVIRLTVLNLSGNDIGDGNLDRIARLADLEVLVLQNTRVTGAGLARLDGMARLNVLNLTNCRLVDGDLQHFATMPNLRIVHAAGCGFGAKAVEELTKAHPMLAIFR